MEEPTITMESSHLEQMEDNITSENVMVGSENYLIPILQVLGENRKYNKASKNVVEVARIT